MTFPVASGLDLRQAHRPQGSLMTSSAMPLRLPPATPFYTSQLSKQKSRRTQGASAKSLLLPACSSSSAGSSPTFSSGSSEVARVLALSSSPLLALSTPNIRRLSAPADGDVPRRLTSVQTPPERRPSLSKYSPLPAIVNRSTDDACPSRPPLLLRSKTYTVLKVSKNEGEPQEGGDPVPHTADTDNVDEEHGARSGEVSPES